MNMIIQLVKKGKVIQFDSSDWKIVSGFNWYVGHQGYAVTTVNKPKVHSIYLHRLLMNATEPSILVDHKNRNRCDNRRSNLRITDFSGNARNTSSYGSTGYLGVFKKTKSPYQRTEKYIAKITVNRRTKYLGSFDSAEIAARAYNVAAVLYFGEFASVNNV